MFNFKAKFSLLALAAFATLAASADPLKRQRFMPEACPTTGENLGRARFLRNNEEAWNLRLKFMLTARKSITTQYYIVGDDDYGKTFLGLLLWKAKQLGPGKVKLMVDAGGTKSLSRTFLGSDILQELAAAGVEVTTYAPFVAKGIQAHLTARNHDKILIVDDCYLFSGGRNIAKYYFQSRETDPHVYEDADVLVESASLSQQAQAAFDIEAAKGKRTYQMGKDLLGNWKERETMLISALVPQLAAMGNTSWGMERQPTFETPVVTMRVLDNVSGLHYPEQPRNLIKHMSGVLKKSSAAAWLRERARGAFGRFGGLSATSEEAEATAATAIAPPTKKSEITLRLEELMAKAQHEIVIQNPYVVLTPRMMASLIEAGNRNVKITLHTNSPSSTDSLMTQAIFHAEWQQVLKSVKNLRIYGAKGPDKIHSKIVVVDGKHSVVGSYNLDFISEGINSEMSVEIESEDFAKKILVSINDHIANRSIEYLDEPGKGPEQIENSAEAIHRVERLEKLAELLRPMI